MNRIYAYFVQQGSSKDHHILDYSPQQPTGGAGADDLLGGGSILSSTAQNKRDDSKWQMPNGPWTLEIE